MEAWSSFYTHFSRDKTGKHDVYNFKEIECNNRIFVILKFRFDFSLKLLAFSTNVESIFKNNSVVLFNINVQQNSQMSSRLDSILLLTSLDISEYLNIFGI